MKRKAVCLLCLVLTLMLFNSCIFGVGLLGLSYIEDLTDGQESKADIYDFNLKNATDKPLVVHYKSVYAGDTYLQYKDICIFPQQSERLYYIYEDEDDVKNAKSALQHYLIKCYSLSDSVLVQQMGNNAYAVYTRSNSSGIEKSFFRQSDWRKLSSVKDDDDNTHHRFEFTVNQNDFLNNK
ncbi:MAG: hypothetical protein IJ250_01750 [Bacteroidales bacterium]|nr:hypothetical protein [Bacteroidales bacterium]